MKIRSSQPVISVLMLRDLIEYHNTNMVSVLKQGTMKNYYTTEKYLYRLIKETLKADDLYLKQLNYKFIIDFEQFLRKAKNKQGKFILINNGVMKHLERFKKMVNLAIKLEWITKNPFQKFQLKFNKYGWQYLNKRRITSN